jgi:hypothetical protein
MGGLFSAPKMPPPTPPPSAAEISKQIQEDVTRKNMSLERAVANQRTMGVNQLRVPTSQSTGIRL